MSAIITNQFRKNSRELFINDIGDVTTDDYFIGIGKSEPWPTINNVEETDLAYSVPLPTNTINEKKDVLKNLFSLLKVQETFSVIPRNEWVRGRVYKVYDPYDPNVFNYETVGNTAYYPCYMTHDDKIFVCLNNDNNTASTTNITETTYHDPIILSDGYVWAYVCEVNNNSNFYTDQFIDVPNDITDQTDITSSLNATGGLVYGFKIIDGGTSISNDVDIRLVGKSLVTPVTLTAEALGGQDVVVVDAIDHLQVGDSVASSVAGIPNNTVINSIDTGTKEVTLSNDLSQTMAAGAVLVISAPAIADDPIRDGTNDQPPYNVTITNGVITSITFTTNSWPKGYIEASVIVDDHETNIQPLIAPINGFGYSPKSDLPTFYAGLYGSYAGAEGGEAPINIGFRQVSLIKGPTRSDNDSPANDTLNIYDALQYLQLSSVTGIPTDAGTIIEHGANNARGYLDYVDIVNNRVYYHQNSNGDINQKSFTTGNVTFTAPGGTTTANYAVSSLGQGEYNQGSGETLFLENRKAILRNSNQQEDIKLIIQF